MNQEEALALHRLVAQAERHVADPAARVSAWRRGVAAAADVRGGSRSGFALPGPGHAYARPALLAAEWLDAGRATAGLAVVGERCPLPPPLHPPPPLATQALPQPQSYALVAGAAPGDAEGLTVLPLDEALRLAGDRDEDEGEELVFAAHTSATASFDGDDEDDDEGANQGEEALFAPAAVPAAAYAPVATAAIPKTPKPTRIALLTTSAGGGTGTALEAVGKPLLPSPLAASSSSSWPLTSASPATARRSMFSSAAGIVGGGPIGRGRGGRREHSVDAAAEPPMQAVGVAAALEVSTLRLRGDAVPQPSRLFVGAPGPHRTLLPSKAGAAAAVATAASSLTQPAGPPRPAR